MLRLAWPTIVVLVIQTLVGVAEIYFVSFLGTTALAGVTLVFPMLMLMTMVSNGGIGGGVASAIGRAIGAHRTADAEALLLHAFVIAVAFGALFAFIEFVFGAGLYRALGASGPVLTAALTYGNVMFAGAAFSWIVSLLAAALRGSGNTIVPAAVSVGGFFILIPLSPSLIFGLGPMPRLGVAGAGTAAVIYFALASAVLVAYLRSSKSAIRLRFDPRLLEMRLFKEILRVGGISAIGALQTNLTVMVTTAYVGRFGAAAIAGFGLASRIDYLLIPLLFGIGTSVVTMVATNVGAGQPQRAQRIAWRGAAIGFALSETIGVCAALAPALWLKLFTHDQSVVSVGARYLHAVAPFYGMLGLGLLLYFASQGIGRVLWPVVAGTVRLFIVTFAGFAIVSAGAGFPALFVTIAIAYVAYGATTTVAFRTVAKKVSLPVPRAAPAAI